MKETYKIYTKSVGGNMHESANWINKKGWAEYLLSMTTVGMYTICVFKMPASMVHTIRAADPSYVADPEHDNPIANTC